ncbi:MAG TPA: sulfotransferase domain-containing protein [Allosphingosinicella sp.]|jgi:hypothetical protein
MEKKRSLAPEFFIAGAQKCGTTALYSYLRTHPRIALPARKEPYFWSTDFHPRGAVTDAAEYARLWDGAAADALRGEATPAYTRSAVAIPNILRERPDARFILLIRNPVAMAASLHAQLVFSQDEDVPDFEEAWRLQPVRRSGKHVPARCADPTKLQYERVCALGDQLERFMDLVPEANRLVLFSEDLAFDPRAVYLRALAFLDLTDDGRRGFERVNENWRQRSPWLTGFHRRLPQRLGRAYGPLQALAERLGVSPTSIVRRLNFTQGSRRPLDPRFEAELAAAFDPQVLKIETLIGRAFPHWRLAGQ